MTSRNSHTLGLLLAASCVLTGPASGTESEYDPATAGGVLTQAVLDQIFAPGPPAGTSVRVEDLCPKARPGV